MAVPAPTVSSTTTSAGYTARLEAWGTTHLVDAPGEYLARLTDGTTTAKGTGEESRSGVGLIEILGW